MVVAVNALLVEALGGGEPGGAAASWGSPPSDRRTPSRSRGPSRRTDVRVAMLQVDVRQAADPSAGARTGVARLNIAQHAQLAGDPPDLAVWGEGALDPGAATDPPAVAACSAIAAVGAPTLVGAVLDDRTARSTPA